MKPDKSKHGDSTIIVYGRNAVRECILSGRAKKVVIGFKQSKDPLNQLAKDANTPVDFVQESELTRLAKNSSHQGFVAICKGYEDVPLEEILRDIKGKENPLLLMLDGIEDPHNLGAILRSCDAFGVDGVILKKKGEVGLNSTVARVSTGAINYVKVSYVSNLTNAIERLKKEGFWIVSSDGEAKMEASEVDYRGPIVLVVGSEGFGISRLVLEHSDFIVKIPMRGHVNSLNASVSAGILLSLVRLGQK